MAQASGLRLQALGFGLQASGFARDDEHRTEARRPAPEAEPFITFVICGRVTYPATVAI
jgi:hypothetical protein